MRRPSPSPSLVYTLGEVATALRVSESTVARAVKAGTLPSFKLGRRTLVPKASLERLLQHPEKNGDLGSATRSPGGRRG
jgi:excisionase family DNA binding protein